jgi:uncharacterized protein (TIGR04255 family)
MSESVENAPVIEVIAELRWRPSAVPENLLNVSGPKMIPPRVAGSTHEFFGRLTDRVRGLGYTRVTRLVPEPFPMLMHQPVLRFEAPEDGRPKSLYQIGPGLFSANAVPPYDSWSSAFSKTVANGVEALLATRHPAEREAAFEGLTLRYLDAFGPSLTEGRDSLAFTREVLGISVDLPAALTQHLHDGAAWKPFLQFHLPVGVGRVLAVAIGDGFANDNPAVLMDWSLICSAPVKPELSEVMSVFNHAHDLIYKSWKEMMKPISHLMPKKAPQ